MEYVETKAFAWWPHKLRTEDLTEKWCWWVPMYWVTFRMPDGTYKVTPWCTTARLARGYAVQARLRAAAAARQ